MLVLSRKTGEKIVIGNEITIEVLSMSGEGVRLGITAPASTSIHRHEVFAEISKANAEANAADSSDASSALQGLAERLRSVSKE